MIAEDPATRERRLVIKQQRLARINKRMMANIKRMEEKRKLQYMHELNGLLRIDTAQDMSNKADYIGETMGNNYLMLETQQNLKAQMSSSDQNSSYLEMSSFYSKTIQTTSPGKNQGAELAGQSISRFQHPLIGAGALSTPLGHRRTSSLGGRGGTVSGSDVESNKFSPSFEPLLKHINAHHPRNLNSVSQ